VPIPETHLRQITRWCQRHVPERARDQVRVECAAKGSVVTIFEVRAPWRAEPGAEWTRRPVAQLRHDGGNWRLHWPDSRTRWHLLDDIPAAVSPEALLTVIDDPRRAFW
jgi:Protein of unknown function (DUF3024)